MLLIMKEEILAKKNKSAMLNEKINQLAKETQQQKQQQQKHIMKDFKTNT